LVNQTEIVWFGSQTKSDSLGHSPVSSLLPAPFDLDVLEISRSSFARLLSLPLQLRQDPHIRGFFARQLKRRT
jgi:hypothetical protein